MSRSKITVQNLVDYARSYPALQPVFSTSGWEREPGLSFANNLIERFLSEGMNWKFNRSYFAPVYTVEHQQDYIGISPLRTTDSLTDYAWLEGGTREEYGSTSDPKPVRPLEAVRDLPITSVTYTPFQICVIPIELSTFGTWEASTAYPLSSKATKMAASPIQQFVDKNGNYLYVSATTGDEKSGTTEPYAEEDAAPGTTVTDNNVTWKVADPDGYALRLGVLPDKNAPVWALNVVYQKKPTHLDSLQDTFDPIPDKYGFLLRQGFIAFCKDHTSPGSRAALSAMSAWEQSLIIALRSGDREQQSSTMHPSESLVDNGTVIGVAVDAANPYGPAL